MRSIRKLIFLLSLLMVYSCQDDLELFENGEDETVIYGVFNIKDSVQYVKIFKTFVVNPDQLEYTISKDDLYYYDTAALVVEMEFWKDDEFIKTARFKPVVFNQFNGTMFNDNLYYKTTSWLSADYCYILKVTNKKTGKITTAELSPYGTRDLAFQVNEKSHRKTYILDFQENHRESFEENRNYDYSSEVVHRFLYYEIINDDTSATWIEWNQIPDDYKEFGDLFIGQFYECFYKYLADSIPYKENVKRIAIGLDQMILFTADETQDYILNATFPKSDFYSIKRINNINNGVGFVGWQYYWVNFAQKFNLLTIDSLSRMSITRHLNFQDRNGIYPNTKE